VTLKVTLATKLQLEFYSTI